MMIRLLFLIAIGLTAAACTSRPPAQMAIPEPGALALEEGSADTAPPVQSRGTPIDADRLNLDQYSLEQQRIDAAIAEQELAEARARLVVAQPQPVPGRIGNQDVVRYAVSTTHSVGTQRYSRGLFAGLRGRPSAQCQRFPSPEYAQMVFLAQGGPERDPLNLDPDGDGFACDFDPTPYRRLAGL